MAKLDELSINAHLKLYGYTVQEPDLFIIQHFIEETETLIKNFCHIKTIPAGAVHPAIKYICGRFLLHKINTGTLVDEEGNPLYQFSPPESSVTVGDVSVGYQSGYGSMIDDNGYLALIQELANTENFKKEIVHFRRIKW